MDENGEFRIVDRKKDMILVSGFNVFPSEIETVVAAHPGVSECAAIGVADDGIGRSGEALRRTSRPRRSPRTRLRAYCRDQLTGYKRPKQIEFRTELPKTPVGKVLRRALRD